MTTLFETIPFRLVRRAQTELAAVGGDLPEAVQNQIETLLVAAADPDAALHYLLSLKQQKPAAFEKLVTSAQHLQYLAAVEHHALDLEVLPSRCGINLISRSACDSSSARSPLAKSLLSSGACASSVASSVICLTA